MVVHTVSNNFYFLCSKYGLDKKIWRTKSFSKMVNPTDEALVMQVVNCYFPRWALGIETVDDDGETIVGGTGKRSGGAVKGEKNTGSRTIEIFSEYVAKFKSARQSEFAELWDRKLQEQAINHHVLEILEKEKVIEEEREPETAVRQDNFDVDLIDGCFGGDMEEDEVATVITTEI
jgi:hypothetical protein